MEAHVYLLPNFAEYAWLKERIPRFVAQECQLFLEEEALWRDYPHPGATANGKVPA